MSPDAISADEMVIATSSDLNSETLPTNPAKDDHTKASSELYTDPAQVSFMFAVTCSLKK